MIGLEARVASAQVLYGSLVRTVTDQTNAVVPQAAVRVTNTSTGLSREAMTDVSGYYSIPNLPQGTYDISVAVSGFRPLTKKRVDVLINNVTHEDFGLDVGARRRIRDRGGECRPSSDD